MKPEVGLPSRDARGVQDSYTLEIVLRVLGAFR